jgi:hypothetical protein
VRAGGSAAAVNLEELGPLASTFAKLAWANDRHEEMIRRFAEFALREDPKDRPYGIRFHEPGRPAGLIVARFIVERAMPVTMSLLAGDLVHNTRVALDPVLAGLKEQFGGNAGQGGFPVCTTVQAWQERVINRGKKSPLYGLEGTAAFDLIHDQQPMHQADPDADPLVIVNALDNDDKHRVLHPAFAYVDEQQGLDLIEITDAKRVTHVINRWVLGQPLGDGTILARFIVRGPQRPPPLRAREDARIGFASGNVGNARVGYKNMIDRVLGIANAAAQLINANA